MKVVGIPEEERLKEREMAQQALDAGIRGRKAKEGILKEEFILVDLRTQNLRPFFVRSLILPGKTGRWINIDDPLLLAMRPLEPDVNPGWPYADMDKFVHVSQWLVTPASLGSLPSGMDSEGLIMLHNIAERPGSVDMNPSVALVLRPDDEIVLEIVIPGEKAIDANRCLKREELGKRNIQALTVAQSFAVTKACKNLFLNPMKTERELRSGACAYEDQRGLHIIAVRKISQVDALFSTKEYDSEALALGKREDIEVVKILLGTEISGMERAQTRAVGLVVSEERIRDSLFGDYSRFETTMRYDIIDMPPAFAAVKCREFSEEVDRIFAKIAETEEYKSGKMFSYTPERVEQIINSKRMAAQRIKKARKRERRSEVFRKVLRKAVMICLACGVIVFFGYGVIKGLGSVKRFFDALF